MVEKQVRVADDYMRSYYPLGDQKLQKNETYTVNLENGTVQNAVDAGHLEVVDSERSDSGGSTPDTCETVKSDGDVCGRELPCPYHSDAGDN